MRNKILFGVLLATVFAFSACSKNGEEQNSITVSEITLNKTTLSLVIGSLDSLVATVLPANASNKNVTWSSTAQSVATVNANGWVTAVSKGTTTITATAGNKQATCAVTVTEPLISSNDMVYVQGGTYTMGDTFGDGYSNEKPTHAVTLSAFYIGKYEVTQKLWRDVMGTNPSWFKGDSLPVEEVSWDSIQVFIARLNAKTGLNYRLPTEAEWEYAAHGGSQSKGYKYSGSNTVEDVAWHNGNSGYKTHAVGAKKANELGFYDMSGNVYEWCSDWLGAYSSGAQTNPQGPSSGSSRVLRGGSWNSSARDVRSSDRSGSAPDTRGNNVGFRLARSSK